MKKWTVLLLTAGLLLSLGACRREEPPDYSEAVLGIWYAVEYENEYVEFREDGTVADTFGSSTTYGDYIVDNETAQIWVNFGDDVFSLQIQEENGKLTLLDNNGTLVREEDCAEARRNIRRKRQNRAFSANPPFPA